MQRLTPELTLISNRQVVAGVAPGNSESQELDFNLARRSAVIINHIQGQMRDVLGGGVTTFDECAQEVDLDPDNILIFGAAVTLGDALVMDSSRIFRQQYDYISQKTVIGVDAGAGLQTEVNGQLAIDFRMLRMEERPISITNLRHNINCLRGGAIAGTVECMIILRYFIVELTLAELGIINATRR